MVWDKQSHPMGQISNRLLRIPDFAYTNFLLPTLIKQTGYQAVKCLVYAV